MKGKKRKFTVIVSLLLVMALSFSMLSNPSSLKGITSFAASDDSNAIELTTDGSSWSSGFSMNITLNNVSNSTIDDWSIRIDKSNFEITSIWCVTSTEEDDAYVITPNDYAKSINKNSSVNFGFCGTGTMPTKSNIELTYTINGTKYEAGSGENPKETPTASATQTPSTTPTLAPTATPTTTPTVPAETTEPEKPTPTAASTITPSPIVTSTPDVSPGETPESGDDWLHVEGNNIVDSNGNKVWITGANWFGFNCQERMFLDSYSSDIVADINQVANKGINTVRVPISTELLYSWSQGEYPASTNTSYNNADLAGLNSFELFNFMLKNFKRVGIKVILDVHSAETDNQGHSHPLWTKGSITEEVFKKAWVWVANYYKNDDTIIGFDLKNEPHTNTGDVKIKSQSAIWDDSDDTNNWKRVAQETALAILNVHPHALIFVEGIEIYPKDGIWDDAEINLSPWGGRNDYYSNWWGGNLRGVKDYPINLGNYQSQLVYSPHDYGPIVYEQKWFQGDFPAASDKEAFDILYNQCWKDNWAYIMEDGISPLLIGEWGGITEGSHSLLDVNLKYLRCMRDYIAANKYKLHHTFWCINIDSADTGGLLTRDEGTPFPGGRDLKWNDNKYDNYLLPCLWKNASGKFIGLDHKVPLGENGVALGNTQQ